MRVDWALDAIGKFHTFMLFKALDLECGYMEILSHTKEWRGEKSDVLLEGGGD